jgi:hypothetical protein
MPPCARFDPAETLLIAGLAAAVGLWLFAWTIYVCALPISFVAFSPVLAVAGLALARRRLLNALRDPDARNLLLAQALVTLWCLGWLSFVTSYSGGGWTGDWFEHWDRARFFLTREALDYRFLGSYALPARPPLANVLTAAFLAATRFDFAAYQLISTLLASLAFFPAALLARRFGGTRASAVFAALLIVNPLFVQNATFAWTKLPAAAGVLAALYFFLRAHDADAPRAAPALFAASLAAALLTHYSAGPAAVVLALAWFVRGWPRRCDAHWWRRTLFAAAVGGAILAPWFAWSLAHYGAAGTFLSNSSVTTADARQGPPLLKILLNLRDTLVPHFLRPLDPALIVQKNLWGAVRDWCFQLYQLNLPLACGSVAGLVLVRELIRTAVTTAPAPRTGWALALAGVVALSIAVHGERDHWGLTHICLQSFVLLALAFLAARWSALTRPWRLALIAGAIVDFLAGIALHFAVQNFAPDRWLAPAGNPYATYKGYNESAFMNLAAKLQHQLVFVADRSPVPPALALALLAAILALMLTRARAAAP